MKAFERVCEVGGWRDCLVRTFDLKSERILLKVA